MMFPETQESHKIIIILNAFLDPPEHFRNMKLNNKKIKILSTIKIN
jgi:hypothetical protein